MRQELQVNNIGCYPSFLLISPGFAYPATVTDLSPRFKLCVCFAVVRLHCNLAQQNEQRSAISTSSSG